MSQVVPWNFLEDLTGTICFKNSVKKSQGLFFLNSFFAWEGGVLHNEVDMNFEFFHEKCSESFSMIWVFILWVQKLAQGRPLTLRKNAAS